MSFDWLSKRGQKILKDAERRYKSGEFATEVEALVMVLDEDMRAEEESAKGEQRPSKDSGRGVT